MAKKILIVENDEEWQDDLKNRIEERLRDKVDVDVVDNCKAGLQKITDNIYQLAIIDIALVGNEDDNGMCLVRVSAKLAKPVPVIIVSGTIYTNGKLILEAGKEYGIETKDIFFKDELADKEDDFINRVKEHIKESTNNGEIPDQKDEKDNNIISLIRRYFGMLPVPFLSICIYALILILGSEIQPSIIEGNRIYLWYFLPALAAILYGIDKFRK